MGGCCTDHLAGLQVGNHDDLTTLQIRGVVVLTQATGNLARLVLSDVDLGSSEGISICTQLYLTPTLAHRAAPPHRTGDLHPGGSTHA